MGWTGCFTHWHQMCLQIYSCLYAVPLEASAGDGQALEVSAVGDQTQPAAGTPQSLTGRLLLYRIAANLLKAPALPGPTLCNSCDPACLQLHAAWQQ